MQYKDYYKILGVSREASEDEIQKAYRRGARSFHPDINKEAGAEEKFKEINEANEVLKDPEKRKLYDRYGKDWNQAGQKPPPGWGYTGAREKNADNFSQSFRYRKDASGSSTAFSDFFNSLFGDRFSQGNNPTGHHSEFNASGNSHQAEITLSLWDIIHGSTKTITFQVLEANERGELQPTKKTLEVKIPQGVTNGSVIRLPGQGERGIGQGTNGDLLLKITVAPDPVFSLSGHTILTSVAVSPWEAALGARVPVRTVDGMVHLSIPAGTQGGKRFRLKGKGLSKRSGGKGDLIVETKIAVPASPTEAERKLFQELSRTSTFDPRAHSGQSERNDRAA